MNRWARGIALASALAVGTLAPAGQFTADDVAVWPAMEDFLRTADIVKERQLVGSASVTSPWVLDLKRDALERRGLWKDPEGRMGGFVEGWKYEIAAYRLDTYLGLHMVPPTVERDVHGAHGSLQLYIEGCMTLKEREAKKIRMPSVKIFGWNRATYLQRAFDNLIANIDRHQNQILITPDWKMILIDHSRAFGNPGAMRKLIYTEKHPEGPKLMRELPRAIVDKIKALDMAALDAAVGDLLTKGEKEGVIYRRGLIMAEIDRLVQKYGESSVLY